jgi:hypothetical protein
VDAWIDIRRKARACHGEALKASQGDRRAAALVAAALYNDDLELRRSSSPGHSVAAGELAEARLRDLARSRRSASAS